MDKTFDISSVDDKIRWDATCALMMLVRRSNGERALMIQCTPLRDRWMLTKTVVAGGDFDAVKGSLGTQEIVDIFDDLQEALGAGSTVARKWLADSEKLTG